MTMTRGIGSPLYMAPEMLRGDKKYTRAIDVFSFGIMCVELWNERLPYMEKNFDSPFTFTVYVMDGHRPRIRKNCPKALSRMISRCWSEDRQERPPFREIVEELETIVQDLSKSSDECEEHVKPLLENASEEEKPEIKKTHKSSKSSSKKRSKEKHEGSKSKAHSKTHKSHKSDHVPLDVL